LGNSFEQLNSEIRQLCLFSYFVTPSWVTYATCQSSEVLESSW